MRTSSVIGRLASKPDPLAAIRAAVAALGDVPRESMASMPDMLFHNRRVAKVIREAADRIEDEWAPAGKRRPTVAAIHVREHHREVISKGRRIRVIERGPARQMELGL